MNKGDDEMKLSGYKGLVGVISVILGLAQGCVVVDDTSDDDYECCYYGWEDCCYGGGYAGWYELEAYYDENPLYVGQNCGCCGAGAGESSSCTDCCTYSEEAVSYDTIYLDPYWDAGLDEIEFCYQLNNYGNYSTYVYVDLCDYYSGSQECFNVIELTLGPGECFEECVNNETLDTALLEFLSTCSGCIFEYDIDVYLGEECTCTPVSLDYYYDGYYLY
jgi:hypothetical protein